LFSDGIAIDVAVKEPTPYRTVMSKVLPVVLILTSVVYPSLNPMHAGVAEKTAGVARDRRETPDPQPPAALGSRAPNLSIDGPRLLLSWLEPGAADHFAVRFASFDGQKWSAARTIVERADLFVNSADFPSVVSDGHGTLFSHWLQKSGPDVYAYDIEVARSRDAGRSWSSPMVLNRDGKKAEHGFVSMVPLPGGGVAAVWLDGRKMLEGTESGEMTLRYAEIQPDGKIVKEQQLDGRVCDCCTTAMVLSPAGPVIAYRDRSADEIRDISVIRRGKGAWTDPIALHADKWHIAACPVNGPQLDASANFVAAAWFSSASEQPRVNVAFSSDGGGSFQPPIRIDGGKPVGRVDIALLRDHSAVVSWVESSSTAPQILARRVFANGRLGSPVSISTSAAARGFPRMARRGGDLFVAWTDADSPSRVHLSRIRGSDMKSLQAGR